jgi:hypothetical protein
MLLKSKRILVSFWCVVTSRGVVVDSDVTKVWIKSYGSALVKVRCNFSDQALWIGATLTKL